jgi:hypothetical protein
MSNLDSSNLQIPHWQFIFPNITDEIFSSAGNVNGRILWESERGEHLSFDKVICSVNENPIDIPHEFKPLIQQIKFKRPQLHDDLILRLIDKDVFFIDDSLNLNLGITSYLSYQATKRASLKYPNVDISMQVAGETCIFTQYSGRSYLIFSLRNSKRGIDDFYRYHSCAGVSSFNPSEAVIYPHRRAILEATEESGIPISQLKIIGVTGIVTDDYFRRSAVLVKCETEHELDTYFRFDPGKSLLSPKFKTDEEVNLTALEWSPEGVRAFLLGQDSAYPFPLVRSFWLHVLLEGGISFGHIWRSSVEEDFKTLFHLMCQHKG